MTRTSRSRSRRGAPCPDRAERRRQDHGDQPVDRRAAAECRPYCAGGLRHHCASVHRRVLRGLSRTFQINQLYRGPDAAGDHWSRRGRTARSTADWWRVLGTRAATSMAKSPSIVARFHLLDRDERAHRDAALRQAAAAGRSRWRSPPSRGCCCWTNRRPVCRKASATTFSRAVASLPRDVTVLLIEHDMDLVFGFADHISVLVAGAMLVEGSPRGCGARSAGKAVYLGEGRGCLICLRSRTCRAGYGRGRGAVRRSALRLGEGQVLALLGRNGTGKTHADQFHRRRDPPLRRARIALGGARTSRRAPETRARAGHRLGAAGANIFRAADVVEENMTAVAQPGPWTLEQVYGMLPAAGGAAAAVRQPAVRRRAADAGDRPRPHAQSARCCCSTSRPKGWRRSSSRNCSRRCASCPWKRSICVASYVEQKARKILALTDRVMVLERGRIVLKAQSCALLTGNDLAAQAQQPRRSPER